MKTQRILKYIALIALVMSGFVYSGKVAAQPGVSVPVESFYNELAPYGQWIQHPGYGNVWLPNAGPDFQPYASAGHWVVTEYGNTWVSDYPWGWAPFHYGRWIFDQAFGGWLWIPGSDWGPAWVSWRSGGGYYGWAPLAPGWDINVNINIPAFYWTFVPQIYITSPNLYSYYVPRPQVVNIYQNTIIFNNIYRSNNRAYVYGPPRGDIERITRRSVPIYRIDHMDRPGRSVIGNGSVGFYRPGGGYDNRRDYGRNDRFDNSPRPNYGGNMPSNRGYYNGPGNAPNRDYTNGNNTPNRDYNGNGAPNRGGYNGNNSNGTPNRDYNNNATPNRPNDGGATMPNRGSYGGNAPVDRGGSYGTTPVPGNPQPQSNRFESNRGSYAPGGVQQGNASPGGMQQPNRSFERVDRQPQMSPQPMPGGRSGGEIHQIPQGGGRSMQPQQPQIQPQQPSGGSTGGEHRGRGPR
ncbi:hypothetical protein EXU85_22185 [Spirosoma sp. KCTC 42546]|uniref:DUF6600 domain-containing protein n=1 Tax=Spirosoma sp. KCTC 42546 TaxID=2520506 RepID=UPI0011589260|nr:DUF6600 domain-containing protein [Spirosoma sp. KCTC 42546]QDK81170.1 hypothetical protein EXU85_22185 [Spirosoma sp. KCTC 42546]